MPRFRLLLSAKAIAEGTIEVVADSEDDAYNERLKRLGEITWVYQGLDESPISVIEVEERP